MASCVPISHLVLIEQWTCCLSPDAIATVRSIQSSDLRVLSSSSLVDNEWNDVCVRPTSPG
eukprot:3835434-Pyramimonas_sp.AAC.2